MASRLKAILALGDAARKVTSDLVALQSQADSVQKTLTGLSDSKAAGTVDQVRGALASASQNLNRQLQTTQLTLRNGSKDLLATGGDLLRQIEYLVGTLAQVSGGGGSITASGAQLPVGPGAAALNLFGAGGGGLGNDSPPGAFGGGGGGSGGVPVGAPGPIGGAGADYAIPNLGNAGSDLNSAAGQLPPLPDLFADIRAGLIDLDSFLGFYASQRIPSGVNAIQDALAKLDPRAYEQKLFEISQALAKGKLEIDDVLAYLEQTGSKVAQYFANIIKAFQEGKITVETLRSQLALLAGSLPADSAFNQLAEELANQAIQLGQR